MDKERGSNFKIAVTKVPFVIILRYLKVKQEILFEIYNKCKVVYT